MSHKRTLLSLAVLACLAASPATASPADQLLKDSVPQKWFQPYLPEDLPALDVPAYIKDSPIDLAEAMAFAGRYKHALITLRAAKDVDPARAARVTGLCYWRLGQHDKAAAALADPKVAGDPRVQILTVEFLAHGGKFDQAKAVLDQHLKADPDSIAGRYWIARVYEQSGDIVRAKEAYDWFVTPPHNFFDLWQGQGHAAFDSAEEVTLIGRALDRGATLGARYKDSARLHNLILNIFVKAYDVIDRSYYPARIAAAEFLMNRDAGEKALEQLQAANAANPRHPEIDRLMGQVMLDRGKLDFVEACVDSLRSVDPRSIEADVLEARLQLYQKQRPEAEQTLGRVLARNPRRFDALGLLAGLQFAQAKDAAARETLKRADALDSNQSQAYLEAGVVLFRQHQLKNALAMLKTAVERAPWSVESRNALGLVHLQSGEDAEARAAFDAAYAVDPFNLATVNYLRLLDQTVKWEKTETDHFIFQYDKPEDPVVPLYMAPYMEQAYKEVTAELKFQMPVKTIIQIYPDADTFSVRMTGTPGMESFAFTFGRLIVSAAPRAGQNVGTFNWARILKHELAHTAHLAMTEGRVPRWLTEGLAVMSEEVDFRFDWVPPVLYQRASQRKLFKIAELDNAFVRPRSGQDGEMAYMTGFWIAKYMKETAGPESIPKILHAYKEGRSDDDAFKAATGKSIAEFEPGFVDWARQRVAEWGYDKDTAAKFKLAYDRGEEQIKANKLDEAWGSFKEASALQPMNHMPHRRLAAIALKQKRPDDALVHLRWLIPLEFRDNRFAKSIANMYKSMDDLPKAIEFAELAVRTDPYDPLAHDVLGELYQKAGDDRSFRETEVAALLRMRVEEATKPRKTD